MDYDHDKIDEMILALLWLTPAGPQQAWKSHDWDAMERLHAKGYISDPRPRAKSGTCARMFRITDNQLSPIVWPLQSVVVGSFPCVGDLPTLHGPPGYGHIRSRSN